VSNAREDPLEIEGGPASSAEKLFGGWAAYPWGGRVPCGVQRKTKQNLSSRTCRSDLTALVRWQIAAAKNQSIMVGKNMTQGNLLQPFSSAARTSVFELGEQLHWSHRTQVYRPSSIGCGDPLPKRREPHAHARRKIAPLSVTLITQVADRRRYCLAGESGNRESSNKKMGNQATKCQETEHQTIKCKTTRGEPIMSRVANASGFLFARQPRRSGRRLNLAAEILFFVEVFGLSSIAMGGAMLLAAYPQHPHPAEVRSEANVLAVSDDPYLQMFATGPGCGWYILPDAATNVRSCDGQRDASSVEGAGD
jgi:hypothetical protein